MGTRSMSVKNIISRIPALRKHTRFAGHFNDPVNMNRVKAFLPLLDVLLLFIFSILLMII